MLSTWQVKFYLFYCKIVSLFLRKKVLTMKKKTLKKLLLSGFFLALCFVATKTNSTHSTINNEEYQMLPLCDLDENVTRKDN